MAKRQRKNQKWQFCSNQQPECQFTNPPLLKPRKASSSSSHSLCDSVFSSHKNTMSSAPGNYLKATLAGRRRRRNTSRRRLVSRRCRAPARSFNNGRKRRCLKAVSAKLETLKTLVNPTHVGKLLKADELFQETADYIVLLRTQVVILQRLVEFYGSSEKENVAAVS